MGKVVPYTEDIVRFVLDNYEEMGMLIIPEIEERFGRTLTIDSVSKIARKHGVRSRRWLQPERPYQRGLDRKTSPRKYTKDVEEYIRENYYEHGLGVIPMVKERFGISIGENGLFAYVSKNKIKAKRGVHLKGTNKASHEVPIGTESYIRGNDILYVKVQEEMYRSGRNWVPKKRLLYEQRHGKIGDNEFIVMLDGDESNFSDENMMKVTYGGHLKMGRLGYYGKGAEFAKTGYAIVELDAALNGKDDD